MSENKSQVDKQESKLLLRSERLHELESIIVALLPEFNAELVRVHEFHKPSSSIIKLWIEIKDMDCESKC